MWSLYNQEGLGSGVSRLGKILANLIIMLRGLGVDDHIESPNTGTAQGNQSRFNLVLEEGKL